MKKLTMLERALIRGIKNQIEDSKILGEQPEAASWDDEEGILLSREEAEYILSMIPGAEDVAL